MAVLILVLSTMAIVLLHIPQSSGTESDSMKMIPNAQCPGKVIASGHRYRTVGARSVLECAARCRPDDQCMSIVFEKDSSTCHLSNSTASEDCSNTVPAAEGWKYLERVESVNCDNGGVTEDDGITCACPDAYSGNYCEVTAEDCNGYEDWLALHNEGVLFIKPNSTAVPFPVFCDRLPAGTIRTRVAVRRDTTTNFNRTWLEYRNGFGEPNSSAFWLGLERLHQLTRNGRFQLRFTMRLDNTTTFYQFYDNFVIGNESANFAMSFLLPVVGRNLGDCLQDLLGVGFSTYDMDNDNSSANCAQQHGAGWWFKGDNCSACNPFGPIVPPFTGFRKGLEGEAFWIHNLGDMIPFPISFYLVA